MIIHGSMKYTPSGRKRKTNAYKTKAKPKFVAQAKKNFKQVEKLDKIPSIKSTGHCTVADNSWKVEASKKFTVAPAYNKGAYQVIPKGDVKWIGK